MSDGAGDGTGDGLGDGRRLAAAFEYTAGTEAERVSSAHEYNVLAAQAASWDGIEPLMWLLLGIGCQHLRSGTRALPCLALPCLALPCLALPYLALPCLTLPCLALP